VQNSRRLAEATHIMVLIYLLEDDYKLSSDVIARSLSINPTMVRRLLGQLKAAGIVKIPPKKGGAKALHPAAEITLWDIYQAVEPDVPLFAFHHCEQSNCPVARNMHNVLDTHFLTVQGALRSELERITLEAICLDMTQNCGITRETFTSHKGSVRERPSPQ